MKSFLATLALCLPLQAFANGYSFMPLFDSHESEAKQIIPTAISHDGAKVVGYSWTSSDNNFDFIWNKETGVSQIAAPPSPYESSSAPYISGNGDNIFINTAQEREIFEDPINNPLQAYIWDANTGYRNVLATGNTPNNLVTGHSSFDGQFTAGYELPQGVGSRPVAVRINNGEKEYIGSLNPDDPYSRGTSISSDGQTLVGESLNTEGSLEAYIWTPMTGMVGLGIPDEFDWSGATGISSNGYHVAGVLYEGSLGIYWNSFYWSEEVGMIHIPTPDGYNSLEPGAISDDGTVFGTAVIARGTNQDAILWDQTNGLQYLHEILEANDIDLLGWQLMGITDVTPDGQTLVGYGTTPDGRIDAFIATIPEPLATLWLLPLGLIALVCYRRTK